MPRPVIHTSSLFARWMAEMDYDIAAAANALGLSKARVKEYRRDEAYTAGRAGEPDLRTRLAMAALAAGLRPYSPKKRKG